MAKPYLTAPVPSEHMPSGIPFIVSNECAERFSYYGMRAILVVFMTKYLLDSSGELAVMTDAEATTYYHRFLAGVYAFPVLGALIADGILGKYRTILSLSIVYCLGHLALAVDETRLGLGVGLGLIALGSGGIKPCVSAHVGDQFGAMNKHLIPKVFNWFYFSINFGAFFSTLLIPYLLKEHGPHVAFGLPGVLMLLATWVFWLGRHRFVHIPAGGFGFVKETFSRDGLATLARLLPIFVLVAMFWSLYDQTGSAWVLQAQKMDRVVNFFGTPIEILSSQVHAANPLLIMIFVPLFGYVIYPGIDRIFPLTPLRKVGIGFVLTALAFLISAAIEERIAGGATPHIVWQLVAYVVMTAAETMVSITLLEFSYTQAPLTMKSAVMAINLLSVSLGNVFTAQVNSWIVRADGTTILEGPQYYWFFSGLMLATTIAFVIYASRYRYHTVLQDEAGK